MYNSIEILTVICTIIQTVLACVAIYIKVVIPEWQRIAKKRYDDDEKYKQEQQKRKDFMMQDSILIQN